MNYSKKIVCLANSRRPSGRCVVGREVCEGGYGGWVRPVSARPSGEVSLEERRYKNGSEPQILDIVEIPMIAAVPNIFHSENHMIDASYFWTKRGALTWTDLADLIDRPESLWMNGDATRHGVNDRINQALATQIANSVFLIEPGVVDVQVLTEVGVLDNPTRRVRAAFRYNGIRYNLVVTDPLAEEAFLAGDKDEYQLKNIFLSVSLTEVFGGDGCCHKLVEAIISAQPLRDVTQARHVDEFAQVRDER